MSQDHIAPDSQHFPPPPLPEQERMVEAILFASAEPMSLREIAARLPAGCDAAEALRALRARYEGRGVQLARVGDAWAFRTAADLGFLMQESVVESRRLSRAATETLAIIAYHQPVTRAEIEEIRGVAVGGVLKSLHERGLIDVVGRGEGLGRPLLYGTTPLFLEHFALRHLEELPRADELAIALRVERKDGEGDGGAGRAEEGDEREARTEAARS